MKFTFFPIVLCFIANVVGFKFSCKDYKLLKNVNESVYLIHSYGLMNNNTLTDMQKFLFLIKPEPVEKFLIISSTNKRKDHPVNFNIPFHSKMRRMEIKSELVARCNKYLNGTRVILLLDSTVFKNYLFLYGCNLANRSPVTILLMEGFHRNLTVEEITNYFNMSHQIIRYQVKNYDNNGFCMCANDNVYADCMKHESSSGVLFFWIFSFICIIIATLMYAFYYITDFESL